MCPRLFFSGGNSVRLVTCLNPEKKTRPHSYARARTSVRGRLLKNDFRNIPAGVFSVQCIVFFFCSSWFYLSGTGVSFLQIFFNIFTMWQQGTGRLAVPRSQDQYFVVSFALPSAESGFVGAVLVCSLLPCCSVQNQIQKHARGCTRKFR